MEQQHKLIIFQEKEIRRTWFQDEWWFAVLDVIELLTESVNPRDYWDSLKKRELENTGIDPSTNCRHFKMTASDGSTQETECANSETYFRIIQSIPSPKAEPYKQWLAKVGYERMQEIENPELAAVRARQYYHDLGYSQEAIERRMQSIAIPTQLTQEWNNRGVQEGKEHAILSAEISKATFGLNPTEHKQLKGLNRENLRDHMTNLELIFTMLGEAGTRIEALKADAQGFDENKDAALKGGTAAGKALAAFEASIGKKVVTSENFKLQIAEAKQQQGKLGKKGEVKAS